MAFAIGLKPFFVGWWLVLPVLTRAWWKQATCWTVAVVGAIYVGVESRTAYPE